MLKARKDSKAIEHKEMKLGLRSFSLANLVSRHAGDATKKKEKIFTHIDVKVKMKSLLPSVTDRSQLEQDAVDDIDFLSKFLGINYAHRRGTMQEVANTLEAQLHDRGNPFIPDQRMHAVQETASCELKSLTVAVASLLNDEIAYQAVNMALAESVSTIYAKNSLSDHELLKNIKHEMKRARERLEYAAFTHQSS